jgi:hypothetical protein
MNQSPNDDYLADISAAISDSFVSPNETDRNWEPANVVDGLFAIARAIQSLANAMRKVDDE